MATSSNQKRRKRRIDATTLEGHLRRRLDPSSDALLAFPLFLTYQLGLLVSHEGASGVDFITTWLVVLCQSSLVGYFFLLVALVAAYSGLLAFLRRRGGFDARRFTPMLLEASVYALAMGSLILFVLRSFVGALPMAAGSFTSGPLDVVVLSAGAGFHEELLFRLVLLGGIAWLLQPRLGGFLSGMIGIAISSLLFALAHHVGPGADVLSAGALAYRTLAGVYFGVIFVFRGFAVAAWTHALYDVYVLSFTP